jgi:ankyrin repeat protein
MIQFAAFHGSLQCFKYLLLNGSDPSFCVHTEKNTTASFAVAGGHHEIIRLLQQRVPILSFDDCVVDAILNFRQDIFEWLIENGLDVFEHKNGHFAIHEAAGCGNLEAILFCLEQGIDLNSVDSGNTIALMKAAGGGGLDCLQFFLKGNQCDVNVTNRMGVPFVVYHSPLFFAVRTDMWEAVKLLMEKGATLTEMNVLFAFAEDWIDGIGICGLDWK